MGISEHYDDEVERLNTQPGLLTIQECATTMLAENASVITKVDTMITAITAANTGLPNATKKTTFALAVFLLRAMAQYTQESSSRYRSVMGIKIIRVTALLTGDTHTDKRGQNPSL